MLEQAIVHYSEISTKSGMRRWFERALATNVTRAAKPFGHVDVRRETGRLAFSLANVPAEQREALVEAVARQPGVAYVAAAASCEPTIEAMVRTIARVSDGHRGSFKISAKRAEKTLPFTSYDVNVALGNAVESASGRPVDVHHPDVDYRVSVDSKRAYIFHRRLRGPAGLPVGSSGKVVSLLSGGIDSPVASYLMMVRGCRVEGLHLWNRSFSGEGVREKLLDLGRALARHQGDFRLHLVPFEEVQQEIVAAAPADVRMLLYRRAMLRFADAVREQEGGIATVTGDSVGQVASQTLPNLGAVYDAGTPPILNPLAGMLKQEAVDRAKAIGTYEVSIRPGEDCCGLLVARHPRTRTTAAQLREFEAMYDLDALIEAALAQRETHGLKPDLGPSATRPKIPLPPPG